jgi:hypothetical protein
LNPFVLDTPSQSLLRGTETIFLRLTLRLGAKVVDAALQVSIREIRKAFNDNAEYPKFTETVRQERLSVDRSYHSEAL